ncbi:MAG: hypothetical protein MUE70_07770 [Desulfobacterales bacterium]|jgi:hypothetical protein|nr:hypothetical protein [Desulfobacterales bacterium]
MKFPVYWIKVFHTGLTREGKEMTVEAYGWSSVSREEARLVGEKRARRALDAIGSEKRKDYEYGDAPLREEVIRIPWETQADEDKFRQWELTYHEKCKDYTVCNFMKEYGNPKNIEVVSTILKIHDGLTLNLRKPLA